AFLGLPDELHATIEAEHQLAVPAFTKVIQSFAPYYSQLEGKEKDMEEPKFPLKRRIPIFGAGFDAWRTDPRTGRRFKHEACDYRARYENVYAPCDGTI